MARRKETVRSSWPDKITIEEFFKQVFNDSGVKTFVNNTKSQKEYKDKVLFAEQWVDLFMKYMDLE